MSKKSDDEHVRCWRNSVAVDNLRDFNGTLGEFQILVTEAVAKYGGSTEAGLYGECCFGEGAGLIVFLKEPPPGGSDYWLEPRGE